MERNNIKVINYYAALAIALIVSVVSAGFFVLAAYLASQVSYNFQEMLGIAALITTSILFIGLPLLVGSKYRWKTVLATYIFQGIFLFFIVFTLSAIFGGQESLRSPGEPLPYQSDTLMQGVER
jgi:hypothetical protein